ncbi:uncharacterized protein BDV14DRAFT_206163 [Aspergillus stella-maris]|uniref:uncharacterized protein n=1 Tax=Aspergillus stella-maris TaxID=1810926 RepID=UPI003CCCBFC6
MIHGREEVNRLKDKLREYENHIRKQQDALHGQDEIIRSLQDGLAGSQERQQQLEALVVTRQEDALRSVSGYRFPPKEDGTIRAEFSKFGDQIRPWTRRFGGVSFAALENAPPKEREAIVKQLGGCTAHQNWQDLVKEVPIASSKIPTVLLQALLAKDVFNKLFTDPFIAFIESEGGQSTPAPEQMNELQRIMAKINESQAHIWRSETLRNLLQAPDHKGASFLQERMDKICRSLATDFLSGPARTLMQPAKNSSETTQRQQELQALYTQASRLALSLWTQRASMRCLSIRDLPLFSVANPITSVHRLQHLDEDDTRFDGGRILLVVQPAILAFGTEHAENYDQFKIWAPAVVLVSEPCKLKC